MSRGTSILLLLAVCPNCFFGVGPAIIFTAMAPIMFSTLAQIVFSAVAWPRHVVFGTRPDFIFGGGQAFLFGAGPDYLFGVCLFRNARRLVCGRSGTGPQFSFRCWPPAFFSSLAPDFLSGVGLLAPN